MNIFIINILFIFFTFSPTPYSGVDSYIENFFLQLAYLLKENSHHLIVNSTDTTFKLSVKNAMDKTIGNIPGGKDQLQTEAKDFIETIKYEELKDVGKKLCLTALLIHRTHESDENSKELKSIIDNSLSNHLEIIQKDIESESGGKILEALETQIVTSETDIKNMNRTLNLTLNTLTCKKLKDTK